MYFDYSGDEVEPSFRFDTEIAEQCIRIADELREYLDEYGDDADFSVFVNNNGYTDYLDWTDSTRTPTSALILSPYVDDPYALTDPYDLCVAVNEAMDEWIADFMGNTNDADYVVTARPRSN